MNFREASRKIDYQLISRYGMITNDMNPIHTDEKFAAATEMKGIIAHGTISLSLIWRSIRMTFGDAAIAKAVLDVRFVRPVRVDELITAGGRRLDDTPDVFEVWARNQDAQDVVKGTVRLPSTARPSVF
ncbi:MAG: acyl dehydratase [Salinarimonadaceae bacterium]|nr:MAG: acyl dehydratase [Salinarimonadaceae bacterium]